MEMPATTPGFILPLAYWLHMVATVVWIGGLAALVLLVFPTAQRSMSHQQFTTFLESVQKRLDPLAWFSLAVLIATGMFQMSANPNYKGFLAFDNTWAVSILVKHVLFFGIIALAAYQTWWLMPAFRRELLRTSNPNTVTAQGSQGTPKKIIWLTRINLGLAVLVLLATAFARAA
jgi:uncharacterized membrane protein